MKVNEIISLVKANIEKHNQDSSVYSDQLLYEQFVNARAQKLNQILKSFNYVDTKHYKTYCIKLEKALSHECGCITHGCDVLKSQYEIPGYISGRNRATLVVHGLGTSLVIDPVDEKDLQHIKFNDIKKNKPLYTKVNNRLVIWNNTELEALQLTAIWEDILEWDDKQYCTNNNPCKNIFDEDLGVDKAFVNDIMTIIRSELKLPLTLEEDITNNNNEKN